MGPRAVIATHQRRGVGQWGRAWVSPPGGVWISAALPWTSPASGQAGLLGLALALSLVQRLERRGLSVQIKWPNDLLVHGRKLAGLLPGVVQRGSQLRLLRIGLGLNVRNPVPSEGIALRGLEGQRASDQSDGRRKFCWLWITVTTVEAMVPGASMTFRPGSGPIASFIPRMGRSGGSRALNATALRLCQVQGRSAGAAGPESRSGQ